MYNVCARYLPFFISHCILFQLRLDYKTRSHIQLQQP